MSPVSPDTVQPGRTVLHVATEAVDDLTITMQGYGTTGEDIATAVLAALGIPLDCPAGLPAKALELAQAISRTSAWDDEVIGAAVEWWDALGSEETAVWLVSGDDRRTP